MGQGQILEKIYKAIYDKEIYEAIYIIFKLITMMILWRKAKINGEIYVFLYYFVTNDNNLSSQLLKLV